MSQVTKATEGVSWNGFYFVPFNEPKENSHIIKLNFLCLVSRKNDTGMLSEWNLEAFINFRNSSPKARSAIPDSKWELGVCARVPPHKCAFCTPSRSSLGVFKVRIGSMGKNILGGKGGESPTQRQDILKFHKTGTLPDIFPPPTFLHFTVPGYNTSVNIIAPWGEPIVLPLHIKVFAQGEFH